MSFLGRCFLYGCLASKEGLAGGPYYLYPNRWVYPECICVNKTLTYSPSRHIEYPGLSTMADQVTTEWTGCLWDPRPHGYPESTESSTAGNLWLITLWHVYNYYCPPTRLREDNVFSHFCLAMSHSVHRVGLGVPCDHCPWCIGPHSTDQFCLVPGPNPTVLGPSLSVQVPAASDILSPQLDTCLTCSLEDLTTVQAFLLLLFTKSSCWWSLMDTLFCCFAGNM